MSKVVIRLAQHNDLGAIVALLADDPLGALREDTSDPPHKAYQSAFDHIQSDPRNMVFVAEQSGRVIGCLQLTFIPGLSHKGSERAQIESVRVDKSIRGKGLGKQLVEAAIQRAREHGCRMVQLTTDASRSDAQHFYQSIGFTPSHVGMKLSL